jgi:hypothetical protein
MRRKGLSGWLQAAIVESIGIGACLLLLGARTTEQPKAAEKPGGWGAVFTVSAPSDPGAPGPGANWMHRLRADVSDLSSTLLHALADTESDS